MREIRLAARLSRSVDQDGAESCDLAKTAALYRATSCSWQLLSLAKGAGLCPRAADAAAGCSPSVCEQQPCRQNLEQATATRLVLQSWYRLFTR